jgi:hypothetical protein
MIGREQVHLNLQTPIFAFVEENANTVRPMPLETVLLVVVVESRRQITSLSNVNQRMRSSVGTLRPLRYDVHRPKGFELRVQRKHLERVIRPRFSR